MLLSDDGYPINYSIIKKYNNKRKAILKNLERIPLHQLNAYCTCFIWYGFAPLRRFYAYFLTVYSMLVPVAFAQSTPADVPLSEIDLAMVPAPSEEHMRSADMPVETETSWIDKTEDYFSESVHDFSTFLDEGLAKEEGDSDLVNRSYIKLKYKGEYSHYGDFDSDERISIRVDLPHVKDNWNLIFETDPEDYDSLESKQRGLSSSNSKNRIDGAIGGVRLQEEELNNWRTNLDLGVKIRFPLDPFVRAELHRVDDLSEYWTSLLKQELFYYHSVGFGSLTEVNFYHAFSEDFSEILKASSSGQYIYEDDNWELLFQLTYFDRLSNNHLLEYSTGVSIEPNLADEVSNSWVSVAWRQKIYSNWLYLSMIPQIDAPREHDYKINAGFRFELEAVFSKNRKLDRLNRYIPESTRLKN